jgi:hypothetical protein
MRAVAVAAVVVFIGGLAGAHPVGAQGRQAYLSFGAGATELSGGAEWFVGTTPVAIGAEMGVGNLLVTSLTTSYEPSVRQRQREVHPFLRASLTAVASSPYSAGCVGLGGGLSYWPGSRRVGLRVEGTKLWPAFVEEASAAHEPEPFAPRLWTLRSGVAIRW